MCLPVLAFWGCRWWEENQVGGLLSSGAVDHSTVTYTENILAVINMEMLSRIRKTERITIDLFRGSVWG